MTIASTDDDGSVTRPFHARQDDWSDHFCLVGAEIIGITPLGRATARLFEMNARGDGSFARRLLKPGHPPTPFILPALLARESAARYDGSQYDLSCRFTSAGKRP